MSSRELLVLLDGMPEESEYKRARDGYFYGVERDWTRVEYLAARHVAEIAASRGTFDPTGLVSPVEQKIATMKAAGQWPPAWWSEQDREAALKDMADDQHVAPKPVTRERVSSLVAKQLHGRS